MANGSCICACVISGTWESTNFVFRDIIFQIFGSDNCEAPIWVQKFPGSHHSFRIGWQRVQVCALVPVAPQFFGYIKRFKRALNSWHAQRLANSTERFGWTRKNIERGGDWSTRVLQPNLKPLIIKMTIKCLVYYFFRRAIPPHYCVLGSKCLTVGILFVMLNGPLH